MPLRGGHSLNCQPAGHLLVLSQIPLSVLSAVSAYPHFDKLPLAIHSLSDCYRQSKCHSSLQQSCRPITLGLSTALRAALRRQSPSCVKDSHQRPPKTRRSTTNARMERRQHNPVAISCASACKSESWQYDFLDGYAAPKRQLTEIIVMEPTWADKCRDQERMCFSDVQYNIGYPA